MQTISVIAVTIDKTNSYPHYSYPYYVSVWQLSTEITGNYVQLISAQDGQRTCWAKVHHHQDSQSITQQPHTEQLNQRTPHVVQNVCSSLVDETVIQKAWTLDLKTKTKTQQQLSWVILVYSDIKHAHISECRSYSHSHLIPVMSRYILDCCKDLPHWQDIRLKRTIFKQTRFSI